MTYATYGPRTRVHDTRMGVRKTLGPNIWLVIHTSEGSEGATSAEALASFQTFPATATNLASYHYVFDTDRVLPCVPDDIVAYSAAGGNSQGIHGCFPGKAGQTREQWLDPVSRAMIWQCALWLCDKSVEHGIPLRLINQFDVARYYSGVCDHKAISDAFKKSSHWDVGPGFPWDVLFDDIRRILAPPIPPQPEDDMFIEAEDRIDWVELLPEVQTLVTLPLPPEAKAATFRVSMAGEPAPGNKGFVACWSPTKVWQGTALVNYGPGRVDGGERTIVPDSQKRIFLKASTHVLVNIDLQGYWV
jgi:hypothetical protein